MTRHVALLGLLGAAKRCLLLGAVLVAACSSPSPGPFPSQVADAAGPHPLPVAKELSLWRLAPSAEVGRDGAVVSAVGYDDSGWIPARVPGTALAAQVEAGIFPDPYYSDNLKRIPGWTWNFLPIGKRSPYYPPWWWRVEFDLPAAPVRGARAWLVFEGINYSANIWLNGRQVASQADVAGTFREYRFDVTEFVAGEGRAALALEVFTPNIYRDLAIHWVDWNPNPPDYNQGLWMPAHFELTGDVALRYPAVQTALQEDGSATLTVLAELHNTRDVPVEVRLVGILDGRRFEHAVTVAAGARQDIRVTADEAPLLRLAEPRLWWPHPYGEPHLYDMTLMAFVDGARSDAAAFRFGVRQVSAVVDPPNAIRYLVNGRSILIRGGGWAPDMLYRFDPERNEAELAYVKDMGLTAIRLEGKFLTHAFYEICDREGILLMPGWCCCDTWESWDTWSPELNVIARASLESQLRRLRRHPSVFTWLNGSDFHPPPEIERMYLDVAEEVGWDTPVVSNATETPSGLTGPSGMKMTGPYSWVPPNYWLEAVPDDPLSLQGRIDWEWPYGGAFGFNSESSPGPSIPPLESLLRMMPAEKLWPMGSEVLFHAGGFSSAPERLGSYLRAMTARLGPVSGIEDFARKAQLMQYEAHRAMFEAQGRNKYLATGHIQWMLNNAWPGMIWQLYDYFLRPGGTYFGAKKALRPVHVQYSYDDRSVWVVNSTLARHTGLTVRATLYDLASEVVFETEQVLADLPPDGNEPVLSLAQAVEANAEALVPVFFADLRLLAPDGTEKDRNFYWLTVTGDEMSGPPLPGIVPDVQVADMRTLTRLPLATVDAPAPEVREQGAWTEVKQALTNGHRAVAFFVEVALVDEATGERVLPVLWDDNYVSLVPGESLTLAARVRTEALAGRTLTTRVAGWNLPE